MGRYTFTNRDWEGKDLKYVIRMQKISKLLKNISEPVIKIKVRWKWKIQKKVTYSTAFIVYTYDHIKHNLNFTNWSIPQ